MMIDVTGDSFQAQVLESPIPVLVDFWADWCMPCRMIEPVLQDLAGELEGKAVVARVNVDEHSSLASEHGVVSIPAVMLFKNGTVVARQIGAAPRETFQQLVAPHLD